MTKPTAKTAEKTAEALDTTKEIVQSGETALTTTTASELSYDDLLKALEGNPEESDIGEDFGGQHERIEIEIGQWSKPYAFVRYETITTDADENGDAKEGGSFKVPLCRSVDGVNPDLSLIYGKMVALPAAATLKRVLKDGEVGVGDVFRFRRDQDTAKKSGKGKGTMMEIYGIRVIQRNSK